MTDMTDDTAMNGRIHARPLSPQETPDTSTEQAMPGLHALNFSGADGRDGLYYVPAGYDATRPAPFVLMLHGAGGTGRGGLAPLLPLADAAGLLLLAPNARLQTWDMLTGGYGPDVTYIDQALAYMFARCAVDSTRIAIGGFSDGASYALSLGMINGDLFSHIVAFSPGFMAPSELRGAPRIYVLHGIHDTILPIERCGRRIVRDLRHVGYDVTYHEFDGSHVVPPDFAAEAINWLTR